MTLGLSLLKDDYFNEYKTQLKIDVESDLIKLNAIPQGLDEFKFYLANSAVHSSNIEGNTVNFDTYLKASEFNLHLNTKEIKEIEDLIEAYRFAKDNDLTLDNVLEAHQILTQSILVKKECGKIRKV